jgi:transposase
LEVRFPEDLREWVPTGTLISWLEEQVDELGRSHPRLHQIVSAQGSPSSKALLRIVAFACVTRVFDDHEVARLCHSDVAYRLLTDGTPPWPSDLARFRRKHRELIVRVLEELSLKALQNRYAPYEIASGKSLTEQLHNRAIDLLNTSCHVGSCDD